MLVLTRKKDEGIVIRGKDGDIRIVAVAMDRGRIRLGIEAPKGCAIIREELLNEIRDANRLSALDNLDNISRLIGEASE